MKRKFKIGDIITDGSLLCEVKNITDNTYSLLVKGASKKHAVKYIGKILNTPIVTVENICVLYDNVKDQKVIKYCECAGCGKRLYSGDPCITGDYGKVFCNWFCYEKSMSYRESSIDEEMCNLEEDVDENDKDDKAVLKYQFIKKEREK